MTRVALRLVLDSTAFLLLLLSFAYWWLGNAAHEAFGTALFVMLGRHLLSNMGWWRSLGRGRYNLSRIASIGLTVCLATAMAILLATSFAISRSIFAWLPLPDSFALREAHMFAAYWVMALVGLHIGLNWRRVNTFIGRLGFDGRLWRWGATCIAALIALQGIESATTMDLWTRLRFDYSLLMWDFDSQPMEFLGHWLAILTLFAFATHWTARLFRSLSGSRQTVARGVKGWRRWRRRRFL